MLLADHPCSLEELGVAGLGVDKCIVVAIHVLSARVLLDGPSGRRCFLIAPLRDAAQVKEVSTLGFFVLERRSLLAGVTGNRDLG